MMVMERELKHGDMVNVDGREWRVLAVGATENGATYVHLASSTGGVRQKNGVRSVQMCGWLRGSILSNTSA